LVPAGDWIWFNSVVTVKNLPTTTSATIGMINGTVTFTLNGSPVTLTAPNAEITYSPATSSASTTFDTARNTWITTVPATGPGSQWMTGFAYQVPAGGLKALNPVTWSGTFTSNTPGLGIQWQWAASAYTNLTTSYNALGVKPVDSNNQSAYQNSDHAGTPENFKSFVTGGARGGGGSNSTGSYSGTGSACLACTSSVSDNFNRSDGPLGPGWTPVIDGGMGISSQAVVGGATGLSGDIRTETYSSDQSSQIQITQAQLSGGQFIGPAVRAQSGGEDLYLALYWWNSGNPVVQLYNRLGGSFTLLATYPSGPLFAGTSLTLIVSGSTLTVELSGAVIIQTTDTNLTGGAPGIMAFGTAQGDDWVGAGVS
jgi:hypothetical protein